MIEDIISSILQVIAFSLIPFVVYLIWFRKNSSFLAFIGVKRSNLKANSLAAIASLLFLIPPLILVILNPEFKSALGDPTTMTGKFSALGWSTEALVLIFVTAVIKTSLSEEILFRGFLAKRLMAWLGKGWGNLLQAMIFGIIHVAIFASITSDTFFMIFIFSFSSLGAFVSALLNENHADGSIIPGWIAHGVANVGSYTIIGLILL